MDEYTTAHLRVALAALSGQFTEARERVLELSAKERRPSGTGPQTVTWRPAESFRNARFTTEAEIDAAFEKVKDELKAQVRQGKTVCKRRCASRPRSGIKVGHVS
jgi:hypothetical protein